MAFIREIKGIKFMFIDPVSGAPIYPATIEALYLQALRIIPSVSNIANMDGNALFETLCLTGIACTPERVFNYTAFETYFQGMPIEYKLVTLDFLFGRYRFKKFNN